MLFATTDKQREIMNPANDNDNEVPKAVGAPRAVSPEKEEDAPETPEKEPFDEAAYRERLREDCLTACESWDVPNLRMLRAYIDGSATAGILAESVIASLRRTEDRSPAAVLAEMLKERKVRDEERDEEREAQRRRVARRDRRQKITKPQKGRRYPGEETEREQAASENNEPQGE